MPIYEFKCLGPTEHRYEINQSIHDALPTKCRECEAEIEQVYARKPNVIFRGGGWTPRFHG